MRLDKFISNNTDISRSEARRLIRARLVHVNEMPAINPAQAVATTDSVRLGDTPVGVAGHVYYMVNKPTGYLCANSASNYPTVLDLLQPPASTPVAGELQIVGRLDLDTTGLVLLTTDGQWNHRVTAPSSHCCKTYRVLLAEEVDPAVKDLFREGLLLRNEKRLTQPAELEILGQREVLLTLSEGRYHQVKRMFAATGNRVVSLHRVQVGGIELDPQLEPGHYRPLTQPEIDSVWQPETMRG